MKIASDVDQVLEDLLGVFISKVNDRYGRSYAHDDFYTMNWKKVVGISEDETTLILDEIFTSEIGYNLPAIDGAVEGIAELGDYPIDVITSRRPVAKQCTLKGLDHKFNGRFNRIFFAKNPYGPGRERLLDKKDVCLSRGIDLMIEDDLSFSQSIAGEGVIVLLFDNPWNQVNGGSRLASGIVRVNGWPGIVDYVKNEYGGRNGM